MNDEVYEIWPTLSPFHYQPELFNLSRNEKENKNMFGQFKKNSYKIVTVSESQFELISRGCVSAVIVDDSVLHEIREKRSFILAHGDAAMVAEVWHDYPSSIAGRVVIEFNLVQTLDRDEQFCLTEQVLEQFRRRFCNQQ